MDNSYDLCQSYVYKLYPTHGSSSCSRGIQILFEALPIILQPYVRCNTASVLCNNSINLTVVNISMFICVCVLILLVETNSELLCLCMKPNSRD